MDLSGQRESDNIEDRRYDNSGGGASGLLVGGGVGTVMLMVAALLFGIDPRPLLRHMAQQQHRTSPAPQRRRAPAPGGDEHLRSFVAKVLADTEDTWRQLHPGYVDPKLVLFTYEVRSACGVAGAAVGPFYCGADQRVYIDLSFYDELRNRLGAPGDFAQAYVIAHEIGHHVQNLEGTLGKVHQAQRRLNKKQANALSVRLELQADFYAGVWAHHARKRGLLEVGDVEEGLRAASAIGDDRLQKQARGTVVPDSFTHGSSEQRVRWFKKGLDSGDPAQGDTFGVDNP